MTSDETGQRKLKLLEAGRKDMSPGALGRRRRYSAWDRRCVHGEQSAWPRPGAPSMSSRSLLPDLPQGRVLGDLPGPVGQNHVGACAHDAQHRLGDDALAVDPPALRGRLHHRVLAADLVGGHRHW